MALYAGLAMNHEKSRAIQFYAVNERLIRSHEFLDDADDHFRYCWGPRAVLSVIMEQRWRQNMSNIRYT